MPLHSRGAALNSVESQHEKECEVRPENLLHERNEPNDDKKPEH